MHITEITYSWPAETFIMRHTHAMSRLDDISLTVASKSPAQPQSASIGNIGTAPFRVVSLPNFDFLTTQHKLWAAVRAFRFATPDGQWRIRDKAIMQTLASLEPDLVHFHFGSLAVQLAQYPRALQIPYTVSLRGSDVQVMPLLEEHYARSLCDVLENASGIHTVCDSLAERAHVLCPSIREVATIRTCAPMPEQHAAAPPRTGDLYFVTVGRLHWTKAFHDLIRAIAQILDARLDIIGDGPEREHLVYLIDQLGLHARVRILGRLPYDEFKCMLVNATAFVQSSIAEGFSNALVEAMALGKAVFATAVGGTTEVITDSENGVLLPVGDPAGMAEKLLQAKDGGLMERLGLAARATAEETFSMQRHAEQFRDFYRVCLYAAQ